jgi:hypothetical protein
MPPHCIVFPPLPLLPAPYIPVHFTLLTTHSFTLSLSYICQKDERLLLILSQLSVFSLSPIHPEIHFKLHTNNNTKVRELRGPAFEPRSVHVRFAVNRAAVWRESPRVPPFAPVSIIPPQLRMHYFTCHRQALCDINNINSVVKRAQERYVNTRGHRQRPDNELCSEHQQQM